MNATLPGVDVRGFYAALGVQLPGWAQTDAPVRCFTDPDAHAHHDRDPSCSVNVHSGAFNCHACGAHGGAYDAALAVGRSPRETIDLMITHGLTERRPRRDTSRGSVARRNSEAAGEIPRHGPKPPAVSQRTAPPAAEQPDRQGRLGVTAEDVRRWARALRDDAELLLCLRGERGWEPETLRRCGIGFDGKRITVPITDHHGALQGLLRLRLDARQKPKVLAAVGTRLGLIPHPELVGGSVVLVEGPSDMLAARSAGLPAIAVPRTHAWRAEWARAFSRREVTVVMDADRPGREAAARIARDLQAHGARAAIVDLDRSRDDGYDLSDWLRAGNNPAQSPSVRTFTRHAPSRTVAGSHDPGPRATGAAAPTAGSGNVTLPGAVTAASVTPGRSTRCATF